MRSSGATIVLAAHPAMPPAIRVLKRYSVVFLVSFPIFAIFKRKTNDFNKRFA